MNIYNFSHFMKSRKSKLVKQQHRTQCSSMISGKFGFVKNHFREKFDK